jgi:hypothetical protein
VSQKRGKEKRSKGGRDAQMLLMLLLVVVALVVFIYLYL